MKKQFNLRKKRFKMYTNRNRKIITHLTDKDQNNS